MGNDKHSEWAECWQGGSDEPPWRGAKTDKEFLENFESGLSWDFPQPLRALLPLCGNSPVLSFLREKGFEVVGVEFVEQAIASAFAVCFPGEDVDICDAVNGVKRFSVEGVSLFQQDYFSFESEEPFSLIYDRAALIAVEPHRRKKYAEVSSRCLRQGGLLYIESMYFPGADLDHAPYSIEPDEVPGLFPDLEVVSHTTIEVFKNLERIQARGATKAFKTTTLLTRC